MLSADDAFDDWTLGWTVERRRGRWVPVAFQQPWTAECQFQGDIALPLPHSMVGAGTLRPRWAVLHAAVPNAVDATASPTGDLVIVATIDSLVAYESNGRTLGRRLGARAFAPHSGDKRFVMTEWAVGIHVPRWDAAVRAAVREKRPVIVTATRQR